MNLLSKISLIALLTLSTPAFADYVRVDGSWQIKPGTTSDVTPPVRLTILLFAMNKASREADAGNLSAARKDWSTIAEAERATEAEAIALVELARLYAATGQFDLATETIDQIYARHSNFPGFQEAVQVQFEIGDRLAKGQRVYLGGWFPWFRDPDAAVRVWQKALSLAPNGPLADECLIRTARLAAERGNTAQQNEALERLVSDFSNSKYAAEALELLANLRAKDSLGPDWDQATTIESADHWRTLADQFPNDPRAKQALIQIALLRDRAARARLNLAKFYWLNRNNPEAAKLMANACLNVAPESAAAKEAAELLMQIQKNPDPPRTIADKLLGVYPRPRPGAETKPAIVGDDLDSLGFKKEPKKNAADTERR